MIPFRLPYALCVATLLTLGGAGVLNATLVTYTSLTEWEAATNGYQTIDFDVTSTGINLSNSTGYNYTPNIQFLGIIDGPPISYSLWVIDPAAGPTRDHGSGDVLQGPAYKPTQPTRRIQANLSLPAITSIGVDLMTYDQQDGAAEPQTYTIRVPGYSDITGVSTLTQPGRQFFGLTSTEPITRIEFILTSGKNDYTYPLIDNFRYGDALVETQTPESSSYLLVGSGLVALGLWRRRSRPRVEREA